ncbi:MAG: type II toxin-antitoxin system VapC family toxin [Gammaproteobacteria bacterium]|nr:type II toxin-antitoxin system VapC family toxin [Gammaproteobacteria bacterium]
MRLLLDTHIVIWALQDNEKLDQKSRKTIEQADVVYVSVASLWEIAIKSALGKLKFNLQPDELQKTIKDSGFEILAIQAEHIVPLYNLPNHHRDPFDRILMAQSLSEPLYLVTHDQQFSDYNLPLILV